MISIVAILCRLAAPQDCREEVVIAASLGEIPMTSCLMGALPPSAHSRAGGVAR